MPPAESRARKAIELYRSLSAIWRVCNRLSHLDRGERLAYLRSNEIPYAGSTGWHDLRSHKSRRPHSQLHAS